MEGVPHRAHDVEIRPARLGSGCDVTESLRVLVEIDGAKGGDADGFDRRLLADEGNRAVQGFVRSGSRENDPPQVFGPARDPANELGSAGLDAAEIGHW